MNIDGSNLILGRMSSVIAKKALLGESINIFNCESIIISGDRVMVTNQAFEQVRRGNRENGPFISRYPDRYVRRSIKRMLPFKTKRGMAAFHRIMCYMGVPSEFRELKLETIKGAELSRLNSLKYTNIGSICKQLGGKI